MIKDTENIDIEKQPHLDFYKDMLKSYIMGSHPLPQLSQIELEKYIAVFSLYLRHTNEAYKYNLPYLSHQHKRFASFLVSASEKTEKLRNIVAYVKKSNVIKKIIDDNSQIIEEKDIEISLNDFLTANLSGNIDFHKSFSLSGDERTNANDIITIAYKQQVRTVRIPKLSKLEFKQISDIVEMLLNNSLKTGGEK